MKIGIVTISYNQMRYLARAIESVNVADPERLEYVIVDAGSTDGSRRVIEHHRRRFSHVIFEPDQGPPDGLNKGFAATSADIRHTLSDAGVPLSQFQTVFDFGCGCGRVIRHWRSLTRAALYGVDQNRDLVEWCRRNLPFAEFQSNALEPRLDYADQKFEFAYALSVFTHMPEDLQQPWMSELWRILRPGGYLLITTQGDEYLPKLTETERTHYGAGRIVVRYGQAAGSNLCSVYHSEPYVRQHLQGRFSMVLSRPRGATGNGNQDIYLLRKPQ